MATKTKAVSGGAKASKAKASGKDAFSGKGLRAAVGKAVKASTTKASSKATAKATKAKPDAKPVEVVDVTAEVMGALEQQAKATKAKAAKPLAPEFPKASKAKASKAKAEPVAVVEPVVVVTADEVAETKAADAVYEYAEHLGIDIGDVLRVAKSVGEYHVLREKAGMEITDRVVWLAAKKAREWDAKFVKPYSPTTGLGRAPSTKKVSGAKGGKASGGGEGKARVTLFGHAATAVIRALKATCGMGFAQIRNVLDAMGADSVADATIRCQMAGGGLKRGEPAPLTAEQIEKAKSVAASVPAAC